MRGAWMGRAGQGDVLSAAASELRGIPLTTRTVSSTKHAAMHGGRERRGGMASMPVGSAHEARGHHAKSCSSQRRQAKPCTALRSSRRFSKRWRLSYIPAIMSSSSNRIIAGVMVPVPVDRSGMADRVREVLQAAVGAGHVSSLHLPSLRVEALDALLGLTEQCAGIDLYLEQLVGTCARGIAECNAGTSAPSNITVGGKPLPDYLSGFCWTGDSAASASEVVKQIHTDAKHMAQQLAAKQDEFRQIQQVLQHTKTPYVMPSVCSWLCCYTRCCSIPCLARWRCISRSSLSRMDMSAIITRQKLESIHAEYFDSEVLTSGVVTVAKYVNPQHSPRSAIAPAAGLSPKSSMLYIANTMSSQLACCSTGSGCRSYEKSCQTAASQPRQAWKAV